MIRSSIWMTGQYQRQPHLEVTWRERIDLQLLFQSLQTYKFVAVADENSFVAVVAAQSG